MANDSVVVKNPYRHVAYEEADAGEAGITPGELLERDANGDFLRHNTATGPWGGLVAGMPIDPEDDKDDDYDNGARVRAIIARRGMVLDLFLANGENASVTSLLASDGDGALDVYAGQAVDEGATGTYTVYEGQVIVGEAREALNNSSGSPSRIEVFIY